MLKISICRDLRVLWIAQKAFSTYFGGKRRWVPLTEFVYFDISKIVLRNLGQFRNITSDIYAKYHVQIMLLFVYTTTPQGFVIFKCRYFQLS